MTTAPAEPPKDGEVAALIEWLEFLRRDFRNRQQTDDVRMATRAIDALARLSAPVPDKPMPLKFTNEWLKKGIESDGDDEPSAGDSPCTR